MSEKKILASKLTVTAQPGSTVLVTGEITADILANYRTPAISNLGNKVKIDGFRDGKIPENVLINHIGEMGVLEEMAQIALAEAYPQILQSEKIDAIGRPEIQITKIAPGNELCFSIMTAVMPVVKVADYTKIAKKINKPEIKINVDDKEVTEAITHLRKMRAQANIDQKKHQENKEQDNDFSPTKLDDIKDEDLPEFDDEFVKGLGKFASVDDFKTKLKENIKQDKEHREKEKRQMDIIETIEAESDFSVPEILVNYELDKMLAQQQQDIAMSGMEWSKYLEAIKKTVDELKTDWKETATKRSKIQLIINHIAVAEKIDIDDKKVEEETRHLMKMYGDQANENNARAYVASMLTNQAVFDWLAKQN